MTASDVVKLELPEQPVPGKRLGRHVEHDPRSRNFEAPMAAQIVSVKHQAVGLPLDQGKIGQFAQGGRFCMTFDTWDKLLRQQGDVTVPLP